MKFTVVIPAYNAEKYIEKCILSVINQTYKNVEIIIVNDGSTDRTSDIIEDINVRYNHILKCISIPNQGLANARNVGISCATGDFLLNLDSDDFLDHDILENIANVKANFDVCFYGWKDIDENTNGIIGEYDYSFLKHPITGPEAALKKIKREIWICQGNAVYSLRMIREHNIWNKKGINQGEDFYFIMMALTCAKSVVSLSTNSFNCTLRRSSMMHSNFNLSHLQMYDALNMLYSDIKKKNIPEGYKYDLLKYIAKESVLSRVNIAKKISDSFNFFNIMDAYRLIKKHCLIPDILSSKFDMSICNSKEIIQYKIFSLSKILFFVSCKLFRVIAK